MRKNKRPIRLAVLAVLIVLAVIGLDQRMIVRKYVMESSKIDAPIRLAVLADFHGCDYGDGLIPAVEALQPDAVLLPGISSMTVCPGDPPRRWCAAWQSVTPAIM